MDKLEYIPGDLVMTKTETNNFIPNGVVCKFYEIFRDKVFGSTVMLADNFTCKKEDIAPIPLTPEILEKNGWKKEVMSRGVKNSHWVYTKPDIEEYGYFPIYIEKGIGDEFDVYPFTDNNVCKQIAYIKYVHQLQHLLFGLSINHEMEVQVWKQ